MKAETKLGFVLVLVMFVIVLVNGCNKDSRPPLMDTEPFTDFVPVAINWVIDVDRCTEEPWDKLFILNY